MRVRAVVLDGLMLDTEAARRLGVRPNDCVALEDSDAGVWITRAASGTGITRSIRGDGRRASIAGASFI
jgi:hypothetical protein